MKTMFINPPLSIKDEARTRCTYKFKARRGCTPPLGLAYMAAVLEMNDHPVSILDANAIGITVRDIVERVKQEKPGVIGITTYTDTIGVALQVAKKVKQNDESILVVLGGPYTSHTARCLVTKPFIDFVLVGESEFPYLDFIEAIDAGSSVGRISNIMTKEKASHDIEPVVEHLENLDRLPIPAYHLLPMNSYHPSFRKQLGHRPRLGVLMTTRGCLFHCGFCDASMGHAIRQRSMPLLQAELDCQVQQYQINELMVLDDLFTFDKANGYQRTLALCKVLKQYKLPWSCNTRLDFVNEQVLRAMSLSGCKRIHVGIESLNPEVLKRAGKGIDIGAIKAGILKIKQAGIEASGNFIYGLPGDTIASFNRTISKAKSFGLDFVNIYPYNAHPGTRFSREGYHPALSESDTDIRSAYRRFYDLKYIGQKMKQATSWFRKAQHVQNFIENRFPTRILELFNHGD
jgi:anaerobic magnesium-protoporphyrin IX monomethyl ester cyclase